MPVPAMMRAARMHAVGAPMSIETIPEPGFGTGIVSIDIGPPTACMRAARIVSGMKIPLPFPDSYRATHLAPERDLRRLLAAGPRRMRNPISRYDREAFNRA